MTEKNKQAIFLLKELLTLYDIMDSEDITIELRALEEEFKIRITED